jgi:threonine/homoserine/homoserine lactone efflux protein
MPLSGPIALIVFRSSLKGSFGAALRVVIGAAIAEAIYCALATFGYVKIIATYPFLAKYIRYIGATLLIVLGIIFMFQKVHLEDANDEGPPKKEIGWLSGFLIAILNPTLFLTWGSATSTIFSWFNSVSLLDMVLFPIAAGLGIVAWFSILLEVLKKFRARIGEKFGFYAIRIAAVIMLGSGTFLLTQAGK